MFGLFRQLIIKTRAVSEFFEKARAETEEELLSMNDIERIFHPDCGPLSFPEINPACGGQAKSIHEV
jgi:hypothetical protein